MLWYRVMLAASSSVVASADVAMRRAAGRGHNDFKIELPNARSVARWRTQRRSVSDDGHDWTTHQPSGRPGESAGRATYAYEYWHDEAPLYGVIVTPTIGRGPSGKSIYLRHNDHKKSTPSSPIRTPRLRAPATSRRGGPQRRPGLNEAGAGS